MTVTINRRQFLSTSLLAGITVAGATALGGCAAPAKNAKENLVDESGDAGAQAFDMEETCDIVVCGTGTAGTSAVARAVDLGAKVICLEKRTERGGTSQFTEGFACVNSSATKKTGVEFDKQEAYLKIMEYEDWGSLSEPLRAYINMSGEAVDWVESKGVEVTPTNPILMSDEITYVNGTTVNGEYTLNGPGLNDPMWAFAESTGKVDLRLETSLTGLVIEDGQVKGAYATDASGKVIRINAKAVILATGGFCGNAEMVERYMNVPYDRFVFYGLDGREGDGIRFAIQAGAAMHAPSALMYTFGGAANTVEMNNVLNAAIAWEVHVTVNQDGKRFYNEGLAYTDPTNRNIALLNQQAAYAIVDSAYIERMAAMGDIDYGSGKSTGDLLENLKSNPDCHKADTLQALAQAIGVDYTNLEASVEAYNQCVKNRIDPEFNVMPDFLINSVTQAPFYAVRLKASSYTTLGGLASDGDMRVLNEQMSPIVGLFACGTDNGSLYYRDYPMSVFGGLGQGWCLTSGYLAANAACM
ncbi:hypothetical protein B5F40_13130 [Gordonibacter sp. An230]|uniref:FAD-dependent oxidoreductase n=1 Tax=Gordonibacter sp. An230 TaxID=1965592 RepID=UPI000B391220|nr:FAD-binding protein [Gordonibacter sp. An230]OUO88002.1 hypothetical protein B5F40_13130 [Gordonibacter sp. An230]